MPENIKLRVACDADFGFARTVYFETMRWIIERLFGWDEVREAGDIARIFGNTICDFYMKLRWANRGYSCTSGQTWDRTSTY